MARRVPVQCGLHGPGRVGRPSAAGDVAPLVTAAVVGPSWELASAPIRPARALTHLYQRGVAVGRTVARAAPEAVGLSLSPVLASVRARPARRHVAARPCRFGASIRRHRHGGCETSADGVGRLATPRHPDTDQARSQPGRPARCGRARGSAATESTTSPPRTAARVAWVRVVVRNVPRKVVPPRRGRARHGFPS